MINFFGGTCLDFFVQGGDEEGLGVLDLHTR